MDTKLTIELPAEIMHRAEERATLEGTNLSALIQKYIEDFADELDDHMLVVTTADGRMLTDFDPYESATNEETKESLAVLEQMRALGKEISKHWSEEISAVDAIRDVRREL